MELTGADPSARVITVARHTIGEAGDRSGTDALIKGSTNLTGADPPEHINGFGRHTAVEPVRISWASRAVYVTVYHNMLHMRRVWYICMSVFVSKSSPLAEIRNWSHFYSGGGRVLQADRRRLWRTGLVSANTRSGQVTVCFVG